VNIRSQPHDAGAQHFIGERDRVVTFRHLASGSSGAAGIAVDPGERPCQRLDFHLHRHGAQAGETRDGLQ
jgi:hypothetical protein